MTCNLTPVSKNESNTVAEYVKKAPFNDCFVSGNIIHKLAIKIQDKSKSGMYAPIIKKTKANAVETAQSAIVFDLLILSAITTTIK